MLIKNENYCIEEEVIKIWKLVYNMQFVMGFVKEKF